MKDLKFECDTIRSKLEVKEKLYSDLQIDFDVTSKKLEQIQSLNDNLIKDKEDLLKVIILVTFNFYTKNKQDNYYLMLLFS